MKVNINSYLKRLSSVNILDTITESVANSLQADAKNIVVDVEYEEKIGELFFITGISILDDGEGFNLANRESFDTFMSDKKLSIGCRGVGRFSYLKVFSIVGYESVCREQGQYKKVNFKFNKDFDHNNFLVVPTTETKTYTKLNLSVLNQKFQKEKYAVKSIEEIRDHLYEKLLVEFSLKDSFKVTIKNNQDKQETITEIDIPKFEKRSFTITQEQDSGENLTSPISKDFTIKYHFGKDVVSKSFFCTKRITVKDTGIKINLQKEEGAIFLIFSDYLDKYVDDFRTKYDLPKDAAIPFKQIENEITKQFSSLVDKQYPNIESENVEISKKLRSKYPYLKRYISTEGYVGVVDSKDVVKKAIKSQQKAKQANISKYDRLEQRYHKKLVEHKVDKRLINEFIKHIEETNEINKENLVEFIWYSDTILDFLIDVVEKNIGDEKLIHNLIIKKSDAYHNEKGIVQAERNNMWIFGHQFMGYNYIASQS